MPDDRFADPFAPPPAPRMVRCSRCGVEYASERIEWRPLPRGWPIHGAWCCPTPGCIAVGFGFDILPADARGRDARQPDARFAVESR